MLAAWTDLSTCRPVGMVVGLIPWTAMMQWCAVQGFDDEATDLVVAALRYLDEQEFKKRSQGGKR